MRNFYDFDMVPLGTEGLDISVFDCNCDEVNSFFHDEATAYQDELFGKSFFYVIRRIGVMWQLVLQ